MKYRLSGEEIMFLCQQIGIKQVYGIRNPFDDLGLDDVDRTLKNAAISISSKGYVDEDFDGNITVPAELRDAIRALSLYDCMLSIETIRDGKYCLEYFFRYTDTITQLSTDGASYEISDVDLNYLIDMVEKIVADDINIEISSEKSMTVPTFDLRDYRLLIEEGDIATVLTEMKSKGYDEDLTKIYIDSVERKNDFTGLSFIYDVNCDRPAESILYIRADKSLISISYEMVDYEDCTLFREISGGEIKEKLTEGLKGFEYEEPQFYEEEEE